jgi:hypothetical protein
VAGCEWGAVSDKRDLLFGAKPALLEAPVRAAQRRPSGGVRSGKKMRSYEGMSRRSRSSITATKKMCAAFFIKSVYWGESMFPNTMGEHLTV